MSNRYLGDYEEEIINQILIIELCLEICKEIPTTNGLGPHFYPYFYNLNYSQAVLSLYSLLKSKEKKEISFDNYFIKYKKQIEVRDKIKIDNLKKSIDKLSKDFSKINYRNKVHGHKDENFKHLDFVSGYCVPKNIDNLIVIIKKLKKEFF